MRGEENMAEYLYETHLHTAQSSACGSVSGADMADYYKSLGYAGIFVTDHFLNGNTTADASLPYAERIEIFCSGYESAKARGDKIGLTVLFGVEYSHVHGNHFLLYGIDKAFLLAHPEIMTVGMSEVCDLVHSVGGIVIQAHPFREAAYVTEFCLLPHRCDGIEIFNACNIPEANAMARLYAEHYALPFTAGSDIHHKPFQKPLGSVISSEKIRDEKEYIRLFREGKISPRRVILSDDGMTRVREEEV